MEEWVLHSKNNRFVVITVQPIDVTTWGEWKPVPEKKVLEVTLEDVAKQFKVDEVRIVEKK